MIQEAARKVSSWVGRESKVIAAARPVYERVLNGLTFGRGVAWSINGIACRIDARCRSAMGQMYDPEAIDFLRKAIRPGFTCYDVGANLGVYAIQFSHLVGPNGRVVAFEPNPYTLRMLRFHVAINNLANVEVVPAAVSDASGEADFYASEWDGMGRMGAPNQNLERTERISVPITTIDEHVARTGFVPNLILIDIEGFEIAALEGGKNTLLKHRPTVVVEMHPNVWNSAGTDRGRAEYLMRELGLWPEPFLAGRDPFRDHGLVVLRPA